MEEMVSSAYCLPVRPTVTTRMMDAEPMIMPSMVSRKRTLEARKLSMASRTVSRMAMVAVALARVASKVTGRRASRILVSTSGAEGAAVAGLGMVAML